MPCTKFRGWKKCVLGHFRATHPLTGTSLIRQMPRQHRKPTTCGPQPLFPTRSYIFLSTAGPKLVPGLQFTQLGMAGTSPYHMPRHSVLINQAIFFSMNVTGDTVGHKLVHEMKSFFGPWIKSFFFFLINSYSIYLFIFGCVGSSFLCEGFL